MSWDVYVLGATEPPPPVAEMPDDWRGASLGSADEVRRKITVCLPETDWSDPTWGCYAGAGFTFEFSVRAVEPCDGFMIFVRGGGDAVPEILRLAERWGWYPLDCSSSEWFHHTPDVGANWQEFQAYRDRVLGQYEQPPPG